MNSMYHVKWEIDVDAGNAEEAALKARQIQLDPESTATVFEVSDDAGEDRMVDTQKR